MPTEDNTNIAAATSGTDGAQTGTTSGTGDGNNGAGGDGSELEGLTPAELAKLIREQRAENASTRKKLRDAEQAEAARAAKAKEAEEERLKKQGEFQTLAEQRAAEIVELKAKADKVDALEARIKASNDAIVAQIPDTMRALIPKYDPAELSEWLAEHADKLKAKPAPNLDAGKTGERGNQPTQTQKPRVRL